MWEHSRPRQHRRRRISFRSGHVAIHNCQSSVPRGCSRVVSVEAVAEHECTVDQQPWLWLRYTPGRSSPRCFWARSGLLRICADRSVEDSVAPMTALTNSFYRGGDAEN